jgi:hypothetical protein
VEIGDVAGTADTTVTEGQTSGDFPASGDTLTLADITGLSCSASTETDYYLCLKFTYSVENILTGVTANYNYYAAAALRFDVKAPGAPTDPKAEGGDTNIKVSWTEPGDDDLLEYHVFYREEGATDWPSDQESTVAAGTTKTTLSGLTNGTVYQIKVVAVDEAENESADSEVATGTPMPMADYWEYYHSEGGEEQGGFCFVATAAYGSYGDAMVLPLRAFRDAVLAQSAAGRSLIAGYYQYGPRWARAIRGSELHQAIARGALLPAVALAEASALGLAEWGLLIGGVVLALVLLRLGWRHRRAVRAPLLGLLMAGIALAAAAPARAEGDPNFQVQVRFGPYHPNVDSQGGLTAQPFKTVFGGGDNMLFEAGVDWEIWHGFGVVAVGGTFGFVQYVGKSRIIGSDGEVSDTAGSDTTVFNLVPLRLTASYAFDFLFRKWSVPLVPYGFVGLDYCFWWITDGVGDVAVWKDATGNSHDGSGGLFGFHVGAGLKLLLDFLDTDAAQNLENQVGIKNSYFFAEYTAAWINNFGSGSHFDVGDKTFMFGLMLEL